MPTPSKEQATLQPYPLTSHDMLLAKLRQPGVWLSEAERLLLLQIVEGDRRTRIAWAVRRYVAAGHGRSEKEGGAYWLAAEECHCSPTTAARAYRADEDRAK